MSDLTPDQRHELLRELTLDAIDEDTYGEPAPKEDREGDH